MPKNNYNIFWTETAFNDIDSIIDYISEDSITAALDIYKRIKDKATSLISFPYRGRIVPELKFHNISTYRELIISPWRIIYKVEKDIVYILSVFDGRRNLEDLLLSRFIND
jgi:toxin ParE1/3/4